MEQKDYFLREIEKIGLVLRAIFNHLIGKNDDLSITINTQFDITTEQLFGEIAFDFNHYISLDEEASEAYLIGFDGMNSDNLELLADITYQLGLNAPSDNQKVLLQKALHLYQLCEEKDKTFSYDRERKILEIRNAL
jgi:hypothetical protein